MLSPVSTGMGDQTGIPPWYVTKPTRSTQPCIPLWSLNRVPASTGWNVTSARWQVTLCDPIWHMSSHSGEACCELLHPVTYLLTYKGHGNCKVSRSGSVDESRNDKAREQSSEYSLWFSVLWIPLSLLTLLLSIQEWHLTGKKTVPYNHTASLLEDPEDQSAIRKMHVCLLISLNKH